MFIFDSDRQVAISKSTGIQFSREFADDALGRSEGLDDYVQRRHDLFVAFAQHKGMKSGDLVKTSLSDEFRAWARSRNK